MNHPYSFLNPKFLTDLGIIDWGYTEEDQSLTFDKFNKWVSEGKQGILNYLSDERKEKRKSLKNYFPEFQSALVFSFPYFETKKALESSEQPVQIASYVLGFDGKDYHTMLRDKLSLISQEIKKNFPQIKIQFSLDTQPILERDLAYRAGLGWFGKNSMLINRQYGSYFIIGSLLLSEKLELESDSKSPDHCGTCRKCIEQCPTEAITEERTLIADKCISTFTIELFKDGRPPQGMKESDGYIFGCDICQEVCPWNDKVLKTTKVGEDRTKSLISDFFFSRKLEEAYSEIKAMSNRGFRRFFRGTSLERTGRVGLLKSLKTYLKD